MTILDDDLQADEHTTFVPHITFALDDVPQPGPWHLHARCRKVPWTVFFPERGDDTRLAKTICSGCAVLEQCRTYALDAGPQLRGIWGGLSERERNRTTWRRR